jgi:hypothetical protein
MKRRELLQDNTRSAGQTPSLYPALSSGGVGNKNRSQETVKPSGAKMVAAGRFELPTYGL